MAWINVDGGRIYAGSLVDARRKAVDLLSGTGRKEVPIYKTQAGKTLEGTVIRRGSRYVWRSYSKTFGTMEQALYKNGKLQR